MAQYFLEFCDLTYDHENFLHENLVLQWAWLCAVRIAVHTLAASEHMHVHACTCTYAYPTQYSECVNCQKRNAESLLKTSHFSLHLQTSSLMPCVRIVGRATT